MLHVAYLRFKNCFSIHATVDLLIPIHIAIHRYVYQLMGVFCDRLKLFYSGPRLLDWPKQRQISLTRVFIPACLVGLNIINSY